MDRPPFVLTLVLTHACNLECAYCYMGEHHRAAMTRETAEAALSLAFDRAHERHGNALDVCFFGGEPLIEHETLLFLARNARAVASSRGATLRLQVTTNGTLLTSLLLSELTDLDVRVTLSIDGTREAHDAGRLRANGTSSYDAVMDAARLLAASPRGLDAICVVTPENVAWLAESVRVLAEIGARRVTMSPAWERSWGDASMGTWERALSSLANLWGAARREGRDFALSPFDGKVLAATRGGLGDSESCSVGSRNIAVAPSGRLYPCERLVKDDRDHTFVIGTVGRGIDDARVRAIARGPADAECEPCPERFRCGGACACANVAETGATEMPGPVQCWYEQTTARLADAAAIGLVEEKSEAFAAWAYAGPIAIARRHLHVLAHDENAAKIEES